MKQERLFTLRLLATYLLAAAIVAVAFHIDLLAPLSVGDGEKIGMPMVSSRTDPSDNYLYFSLIKWGTGACRLQADPSPTRSMGTRWLVHS